LACNKNTIVDNAALDLFKYQSPMVRTDSYPFWWGTLSESFSYGVKVKMGLRCRDFEFTARDVYLAFPSRWHLVDLFKWLYYWHPLRHHIFVPNDDGILFDMSVICFSAKDEGAIHSLRAWLVEVYIPLIWPDLLREAMKIISEIKAGLTNPQSPEELVASWSGYLCEDPKSLSFYKAPGK
jgi:hypothetical protein